MKTRRIVRIVSIASILGAAYWVAAAQETTASSPAAHELRVHVTAGGRFVDDLTLADFAVLEDGRALPVSTLSLVRGGQFARREGEGSIPVSLERSYTLLFQIMDWDPALATAVDYLFASVLIPGDSVSLVTPFKPYHLQRDALSQRPKAELQKSMKDVLAQGHPARQRRVP
jgi:hypothetical protein